MTAPKVEDLPFDEPPAPVTPPAPTLTPDEIAAAWTDADPFPEDEAVAAALTARLDAEDAAREARARDPWALLIAARWYISVGIPVFPIVPRGKAPACRHGFEDATTDPLWIEHWWAGENPQYNIGSPTGRTFDVLDADGPEGIATYGRMREEGVLPPVMARVFTPGTTTRPGGLHAYLRPTGDGNAAKFVPGCDYRGRGGYVLMPPSISDNGRRYTWASVPFGAGA